MPADETDLHRHASALALEGKGGVIGSVSQWFGVGGEQWLASGGGDGRQVQQAHWLLHRLPGGNAVRGTSTGVLPAH